jgi:hypothetical protein
MSRDDNITDRGYDKKACFDRSAFMHPEVSTISAVSSLVKLYNKRGTNLSCSRWKASERKQIKAAKMKYPSIDDVSDRVISLKVTRPESRRCLFSQSWLSIISWNG